MAEVINFWLTLVVLVLAGAAWLNCVAYLVCTYMERKMKRDKTYS